MAIYNGKHCVFEMVGVESSSFKRNSETNVDSDNCYNNYDISAMRNTHLPSIVLKLSNNLQDNLTNTTIQTAKNGNSTALISTSDKLFIQAEKEIYSARSYSVENEFVALTTWSYWISHSSSSNHIKYDTSSNARVWSLRSPRTGTSYYICRINTSGEKNFDFANNSVRPSPCFAF